MDSLPIFLVTAPGLESYLADEARERGFNVTEQIPGGVTLDGTWDDALRANIWLRGATRVLVRVAEFRALHLAQLDKRSRKLPWSDWLRPDVPIRVEATCRKSRIYHHRAAAQRVGRAITETLGATVDDKAALTLKVRIEDDLCTISIDTSGPSLHKRGLKQQVNKAPMRETLAALFLRAAGYDGTQPVYDPMCGSGTFPIEAAEIALGLAPGRARSFAMYNLASSLRPERADLPAPKETSLRFYGSDRDNGAIAMSRANAERAGVDHVTSFDMKPIAEATPPEGPPGLVILNPPYGGRIGNKKPLYGLYAAIGETLRTNFTGWRVGLITSEQSLAKATGLPFDAPGPLVDHGGIKIRLWQTGTL
ncbi:class I SAM-dependent RNA methyltransferase [Aliishimia ponticola]|uniref:Class I SAM-dependent RNA methyltransferase n=1 Tax=Aliishimia ponticola TaxID=2499833 RepID=A0A4S4NKJ2_9RHOB|nr:class I SAM-dependent RNA methyltransferase [Aliishimia ponticola]THH36660.1 class I SAM-dependent RNA methyltransferase [Aliishimia ponticola]